MLSFCAPIPHASKFTPQRTRHCRRIHVCSLAIGTRSRYVATSAPAPVAARDLLRELSELSTASGALGRGVRACLRALYRRANFVLEAAQRERKVLEEVYVEFGPAYVLAASVRDAEKVTRYGVEQRAWPALRGLLQWEELGVKEARARGARVRSLGSGGRYGRHLFISCDALAAAMQVAEDVMHFAEGDAMDEQDMVDGAGSWAGSDVEGVVELRRVPLPGIRTVSARCPRRASHKNGDRKPSLMLWMNRDGVSGGAMCPVCTDYETTPRFKQTGYKPSAFAVDASRGKSSGSSGMTVTAPPPRNMTWRVQYLPDNRAVLCTPRRRVRSPVRVREAAEEYLRQSEGPSVAAPTYPVEPGKPVDSVAFAATDTPDDIRIENTSNTSDFDGEGEKTAQYHALSNMSESRATLRASASHGPVGGCVMSNVSKSTRVGELLQMAYVTASLKMANDCNTTFAIAVDGGERLRTVGTMARQRCPMQVLMWSDRRSKGPTASRRVEEIAWFARQSMGNSKAENAVALGAPSATASRVESADWLPTPLVSVSAMKPTAWRDVTASNGRLLSVPASWEASAQAWVLFDFDDIGGLHDDKVVTEASNKMVLAVRRNQELSGRCMVIQTGPAGLHAWVELREVREKPREWFKSDETRAWYSQLGKRLLSAAHRAGASDGKVDMSSCSAGRFARRPGWRIMEDGALFRSHVVVFAASRVRKRLPRVAPPS